MEFNSTGFNVILCGKRKRERVWHRIGSPLWGEVISLNSLVLNQFKILESLRSVGKEEEIGKVNKNV